MTYLKSPDAPFLWAVLGALVCGIGWLAFQQGAIILHAGNATDPGDMVSTYTIFGAIAFACLGSFRYAQLYTKDTKIEKWRQQFLFMLGSGALVLAVMRAYRAKAEGDIVPTIILDTVWILIGALGGWFIGDKKRFDDILRKN